MVPKIDGRGGGSQEQFRRGNTNRQISFFFLKKKINKRSTIIDIIIKG